MKSRRHRAIDKAGKSLSMKYKIYGKPLRKDISKRYKRIDRQHWNECKELLKVISFQELQKNHKVWFL